MRLTLKNYLLLSDVTIEGMAQEMGKSRETIRRWRNKRRFNVEVWLDEELGAIDKIVISRTRVIKPKKLERNNETS